MASLWGELLAWWVLVEWIIRLAMIPVLLRRRYEYSLTLAWLCVVFFLPELGLLLYLLLSGNRLGRRRARRYRKLMAALRPHERLAGQDEHVLHPEVAPGLRLLVRQAQSVGGFRTVGGNHFELLERYEATVDRIIQDIDAARHHAHVMFYIYADDDVGRRVGQALLRARRRGVECRLAADAAGSFSFFRRRGLAQELEAGGVAVRPLLPAALLRRKLARLDLRNHRKLVIVDGRVAYTGSQNIVEATYGKAGLRWVDVMGRLQGPVVSQLQAVFTIDWAFESGEHLAGPAFFPPLAPAGDTPAQTVPTGPSHPAETLPRMLVAALTTAQQRITITTPYFIPDEPTMLALTMAGDRGVEVDIVLPEKIDLPLVAAAARAYFAELLEHRVRLHLYQGGLLHSKVLTVDDSFALFGSSNMDVRSFYLDFEVNLLLFGPRITAELQRLQQGYLGQSRQVDVGAFHRRPALQRYGDAAAALLSPLL